MIRGEIGCLLKLLVTFIKSYIIINILGVTLDSLRKIKGFCELVLDTHGPRGNHMDMGQFRDYLSQCGLEYMFKTLFGVGGRSPGQCSSADSNAGKPD